MQYYLSPPCFKFEIYEGEQQSINNFETYTEWLNGYWKPTLNMCAEVMKKGAKLGFVVRDYADYFGYNYLLSQDLTKSCGRYFWKNKRVQNKVDANEN